MQEKAKEPEIRFAGFTGAWEQRKIGDYLTLSKIPGHTGVDAKKLTVKLWGKGVVEKTDIYGGSQNTQYYVRRAGQFMYGKLDFLHAAFGIVPKSLDRFESTLDSPAFDLHEIDGAFLQNRVTQQNFYLKFGNIANGSRKAKRIHEVTFLDMPIVVPSYAEQKKIGAFLNKLDSLLTLHQRKYEKLLNIKKSMLEKMFPKEGEVVPEIRFKGFTGAWEQRKFGEMANRRSEVSASGNLPRVEYEDIVSGTGTLNKDVFEKQSQKQGIVFHSGDVLYGKLRPYLQNWLLASFNGLAVGDFWVLEPQGLNSNYLYRIIQTKQFDEIANQSVGTKMPRADWKLVSKATFLNPASFNEQRLIGKFFKDIDSLLTLHQRKLEMLKNVKQAFLEKMFV